MAGKRLTVSEGYPILKALYDKTIDKYIGNFGPEAFMIKMTEKEVPRNSRILSFAGPAGDRGEIKEHPSELEEPSREFGRALAKNLKLNSIDTVASTGGCRYVGEWQSYELQQHKPDTYLVSFSPRRDKDCLNPENIAPHLKHYDLIVYPDMDILMRCVLVGGLNEIIFVTHGAEGSFMEALTTANRGMTVAFFDVKSKFGVSKYGAEFLSKSSYKDTGKVYFKNSNAFVLTQRALIENEIRRNKLEESLTAMIAYQHIDRNGNISIFYNIRETRKPRTFYHKGKKIQPIEQNLIIAPEEAIIALFQDVVGMEDISELPRRDDIEVPVFFNPTSLNHPEQALDINETIKKEIKRRGIGEVFYNRFFNL